MLIWCFEVKNRIFQIFGLFWILSFFLKYPEWLILYEIPVAAYAAIYGLFDIDS
jgi:hypothetical protein